MKNIKKEISKTFLISFIVVVVTYSLSMYLLLGDDTPFTILLTVTFFLSLFIFYVSKGISQKIKEDIDSLKEYTFQMSESKNYKAKIEIKNSLEFLEISIYLKNIAKRLSQKEKKTSKK
jgi:hypothetical membrane protein